MNERGETHRKAAGAVGVEVEERTVLLPCPEAAGWWREFRDVLFRDPVVQRGASGPTRLAEKIHTIKAYETSATEFPGTVYAALAVGQIRKLVGRESDVRPESPYDPKAKAEAGHSGDEERQRRAAVEDAYWLWFLVLVCNEYYGIALSDGLRVT